MKNNKICEMLGIKYPIFQGAMAWVSGGELAGAVSKMVDLGLLLVVEWSLKLFKRKYKKSKGYNF